MCESMKMKLTNCKRNILNVSCLNIWCRKVPHDQQLICVIFTPMRQLFSIKKIRKIISFHLTFEAREVFDGCIEPDESYSGGVRKGV